MEIKRKNIRIEENVYIIYSTLQALYSYYKFSLPVDLRDELYNVIIKFEQEYTKDYLEDYDIKDLLLYEKVTFERK